MSSSSSTTRIVSSFIPFPYLIFDADATAKDDTPHVGTVLILEPDAEVRSLYERAVARLGYTALCVNGSGLAGLETPDAVLVEPGADYELSLARELRAANPELPIVCASIYPAQSFGLGPVVFLEKPFRLAMLQDALRLALLRGV
jgi:two-component system cell cycle sensor histidine kinase/response regulator CckA